MVNPLLSIWAESRRRPHEDEDVRRQHVDVPVHLPESEAVFLVLRRMRLPLAVLVSIFAVSVFGLSLIPGQDASGRPVRMSVFESFYFISYTATTIGFGELPQTFTAGQRMWVTFTIYLSVIGWAYTIGTLFGLGQDRAFRRALALQRFRRSVRRIREPFVIVAGYGTAGEMVATSLDQRGRRFVVLDRSEARIDTLGLGAFAAETPGLAADAAHPGVLGLAGLGQRWCEGVLALADDDETNLAVVMAVHLLRPEVPVIARSSTRDTSLRMRDFYPEAVINPFDRYGNYLVLALKHPCCYQLIKWLIAAPGSPVPPRRAGLADGPWVVYGDGRFSREIAADLKRAGLEVNIMDEYNPVTDQELVDAAGFVAGADNDMDNLTLIATARHADPSLYIVARQNRRANETLLQAVAVDSLFVPQRLVAEEALARLLTPLAWRTMLHIADQDDEWAQRVLEYMIERCGDKTPAPERVRVTLDGAPAIVRWLSHGQFTIRDLLRDPRDREATLPAVPFVLNRSGVRHYLPDESMPLQIGDHLVMTGRRRAHAAMDVTLYDDVVVEYLATGVQLPTTWVWRTLYNRRHRRRSAGTAAGF